MKNSRLRRCFDAISGVCSRCGGPLTALDTVDNARRPALWAGCPKCMRFDDGVSPVVFRTALRLVRSGDLRPYDFGPEPEDDPDFVVYQEREQTFGACRIVSDVLRTFWSEARR